MSTDMASPTGKIIRFGTAITIVLLTLSYLAYTGVEESKSYYVTIAELKQDPDAGSKRIRVAGDVVPGTIKRSGTTVEFVLNEAGNTLPVIYKGTEAPPDTFKDDSQALVEGKIGKDGVFRATHLQAKCASKYEKKEGEQPGYEKKDGQPSTSPTTKPAATPKKA
jgi:cytochrome c-type biogenesis protein CcmE